MARQDLIFIHAPSVFDFRKESLFYGPVSDLVPSTPVFEMYPFGFLTMANRLHEDGYKVRILNLASMMLNDRDLDVEELLAKLPSDAFGIDLHWLPHAQGSLEVASLLKRLHPHSKLIFGGFSSSYFHQELINYPQVDLILRGDSCEEPLSQLMDQLQKSDNLSSVPNLAWKKEGKPIFNPLSYVPSDLDDISVDYGWIVKSVIRNRDIEGAKPFRDWDRYPLTAAFTVRGCNMSCAVCGGSCGAMRHVLGRTKPAFRSPELVAQDIYNIQCYLNSPTFVVGDLRQNGKEYSNRFFKEAKELGIENHVVLELFTPAPQSFFSSARDAFEHYSIQFSPDSHDEKVRWALGRRFNNLSMVSTILKASRNECERFDLFFMIGLPEQTRESALESADFAARLYAMMEDPSHLFVYTSPLAPFLDPGSLAFENPEKFGYRPFARSLEDHRRRLLSPSWKDVLSYETKWMTREEIVATSYDAADRLNEVRFEAGLISQEELDQRQRRSKMARDLASQLDQVLRLPDEGQRRSLIADLKKEADDLMESTICQKRELEWNSPPLKKNITRVVRNLLFPKKRRNSPSKRN